MSKSKTIELSKAEINERIKELEATPRALVGSDSGTHGKPDRHDIYEEISGERYATYSFAGANATRCTEEQAKNDTHGRIRIFKNSTDAMRAAQRELRQLRQMARQVRV